MLESLLIKLQAFRRVTLLKKDSSAACFTLNFAKFLKTLILKNICEELLLHLKYYNPANNTAEPVAKYSKHQKQEEEIQCESESFKSRLFSQRLFI